MFKKVALAALLAAVATSNVAHAATPITGTFAVTATINSTCSLDTTAAAFNFGVIGATGTLIQNNANSSTIVINCSSGTPYTLTLASAHVTGGSTGFNMLSAVNGTTALSYRLFPNLYSNAPWNSSGASLNANGTGTGAPTNLFVYGEIPVQTPPTGGWPTGGYSDTVTATLTY